MVQHFQDFDLLEEPDLLLRVQRVLFYYLYRPCDGCFPVDALPDFSKRAYASYGLFLPYPSEDPIEYESLNLPLFSMIKSD